VADPRHAHLTDDEFVRLVSCSGGLSPLEAGLLARMERLLDGRQ